ncbi:hypothetical protein ABKA04_004403 [Annulohypoxylon sp. FPYF3050]
MASGTGGGELVIEGEEMGFNSQGEPSKLPGMNTGLRGSITSLGATIDIVVVDTVPPNSRKRQVSDVEKGEHNDYEGLSYEEFGASIIDQSLLESSFVKTRVRPLIYEAPNGDDSSSTTADPNSEATRLLEKLKQHRGDDHCDNVPIVLIGRRHGCFVVQELFNLINNQSEEMPFASMKEMICTVVFAQIPGPSLQDSRMPGLKIDSWNNDSTESAWIPSFDRWEEFNSTAKERDVHVVSTSQRSSSGDSEWYNGPVKIVSLEFPSQPTVTKVDHDSQNPGPIYRKIVDEIQTGIFLKALSDERLEALLKICVSEGYCLSLQDCEKRKPLHKAASCVYVTAVLHLLSKGPRLADTRETDGSTPLHCVIRKAIDDQPNEDKRDAFNLIIDKLIVTMEQLPVIDDLKNTKDSQGKSAWDYVDDNEVYQWILELKRRSITVSEKTTDEQELPIISILNAPEELNKINACKKSEATVVRFYLAENGSKNSFAKEQVPIFRLLKNGFMFVTAIGSFLNNGITKRHEDTEKRDNDQVIFKWARQKDKQRNGHRHDSDNKSLDERQGKYPVLMVDQLWLWVLEDRRTVVTSFPDSWDSSAGYNLLHKILRDKARNKGNRSLIDSAMGLANLILRSSVDFIRQEGPMGISLKECFQSSISNIAEKQSTQFEEFKSLIYRLSTESNELSQKERASITNELFQLVQESQNLASILDIQDELKSIKDVFKRQKEVLEKFNVLMHEGSKMKKDSKRNIDIIDSNIAAVDEMAGRAQEVHMGIQELLSLKQKQANAWEARFAREGSEHTQRQSNITMVFTMVTIFFVSYWYTDEIY